MVTGLSFLMVVYGKNVFFLDILLKATKVSLLMVLKERG